MGMTSRIESEISVRTASPGAMDYQHCGGCGPETKEPPGKHAMTPEDWTVYLEFCDKWMK